MAIYPPVVAVVGPTAAGKSRLALELASRLGGEIVSVDSRQIYRYMDIGTAKPTRAELDAVPHYMLDLVAPNEQYSAQRFREEGLRVLQRIATRGRHALAVGGTGFYFRALLDGFVAPPAEPDTALRQRLQELAAQLGNEGLHQRLRRLDPASAERIHPNNLPRVMRALEIVEQLGGPVPPLRAAETIPTLYIGVRVERDALRLAVDRRVLRQVKAGLVEETRLLLDMGYGGTGPLGGLGYREMTEYLHGHASLQEALQRYQIATSQYARRQMTWFRADARICWIDPDRDIRQTVAQVSDWVSRASSASGRV